MKKIFIITILVNSILFSSVTNSRIIKMVKEIKEERVGININELENTFTPFLLKEKKKVKIEGKKSFKVKKVMVVEPIYILDVILNHAAFINKKWYKIGDKLGSYKISSMGKSSVTLKGRKGSKTLFTKKKKKSFIKLNKGNI